MDMDIFHSLGLEKIQLALKYIVTNTVSFYFNRLIELIT